MSRARVLAIHVVLIVVAVLTLLPFVFVVNNIFRTNSEFYHHFFSVPESFKGLADVALSYAGPDDALIEIEDEGGETASVPRSQAARHHLAQAARGPKMAWAVLRPYMLNSLFVSSSDSACSG